MKSTITRRQALKAILTAGSGLLGATFIPSKWDKPVVNVRPLPVHAQLSGCPLITRTVTVGSLTFNSNTDKYEFDFSQDITSAQLDACGYKRLTISWDSGNPTPPSSTFWIGFQLIKVKGSVYSLGMWVDPPGSSSPYVETNSSIWQLPPYVGISIAPWSDNVAADYPISWNPGNVTVTFS